MHIYTHTYICTHIHTYIDIFHILLVLFLWRNLSNTLLQSIRINIMLPRINMVLALSFSLHSQGVYLLYDTNPNTS